VTRRSSHLPQEQKAGVRIPPVQKAERKICYHYPLFTKWDSGKILLSPIETVWKIFYYFIVCNFLLILCSLIILPFSLVHICTIVWYRHFDSDRIGSTSFGGSAHLFQINMRVFVIFELVLIWPKHCQKRIKCIKLNRLAIISTTVCTMYISVPRQSMYKSVNQFKPIHDHGINSWYAYEKNQEMDCTLGIEKKVDIFPSPRLNF
jgi:hypothetical protein